MAPEREPVATPAPGVELTRRVEELTRMVKEGAPRAGALTDMQFAVVLAAGEQVMSRVLGNSGTHLLDNRETRLVWSTQLARISPAIRHAPDEATRRLVAVLPHVLAKQQPGITDEMRVNFGFDVALRQIARDLAPQSVPTAARAPTARVERVIARVPERVTAPPIAQLIDGGRAESIRDHYRAVAPMSPRVSLEQLTEHHVQAILAEGAIGARAAARAEGMDRADYTDPATLRAFSERLENADRMIRETNLAPVLERYQVDAVRVVYTTQLHRLNLPIPASELPRALLQRGPEKPYDDGLHGITRQVAENWRARDRAWKREFVEAKLQAPATPPSRALYIVERVSELTTHAERGERGLDEQIARGRAQAEFAHARAVQRTVFEHARLEGDHPRTREAFWQGLREARTQLDPVRPEEARPMIAAILGRDADTIVERAGNAYKQARVDTRGEGHIGAGRTHVGTARKDLERARDARGAVESRADHLHTVLHEHAVRFHTLVQEHGPRQGTVMLAREIRDRLPTALQAALFVDSRDALGRVEREQQRARGDRERYLPGPLLADLGVLARDGRQYLTRLATHDEIARRIDQAMDGAVAHAVRDVAAGHARIRDPLTVGIITAPGVLDGRQVNDLLTATLARRPQARVLVAGSDAGRTIYQHVSDLAERDQAIEPGYFSATWTDVPEGHDRGARRSPQRAVVDGLLAERAAGREAVLVVVHHDKPDPALERLAMAFEKRGIRVEQRTEPAPPVPPRPAGMDSRPQSAESRLAAARAADLPDHIVRLAAQTMPIWRDLLSRERLNRGQLPDVESRLIRLNRQIREEQVRGVEDVGKAAVALGKVLLPSTADQRDALSAGINGLRTYYAGLRASQGTVDLPREAITAIADYGRVTAGRLDRVLARITDVGQTVGDRHAGGREHVSAIAAALGAALSQPGIDARHAHTIRQDMRTLAAQTQAPRGGAGIPSAIDRVRTYVPSLGTRGAAVADALGRYDGTLRVLDEQRSRAARAVVAAIDTLRGPVRPDRTPLDESLAAIRTYYDRLGRTGAGGRFPVDQIDTLRETTGAATSLAHALTRGAATLDLLAFSRETLAVAARDYRSITDRQLASLENTPGHRAAVRALADQVRDARAAEKMSEGIGATAASYFGAAAALRVTEQEARPAERYYRFLDLQEDIHAHQARLLGRLTAQPALRAAYQRADGTLDLERVTSDQPRFAATVRDVRALEALGTEIADSEQVDLTRHGELRDRHLDAALREAGRVMADLRGQGRSEIVVQLWGKHTLVERALDPRRARNETEHDFYAAERAHAMSVLDASIESLRRVTQGVESGRTEQWATGRLTAWAKQDPTRFPTEIGSRETLRALRPGVAALARSPADLSSLADLLGTIRTPLAERDEPELGDMNSRDRQARSYQESRRAELQERERIATSERSVEEQLIEMIDDLTGIRST
jgi:hypothetical protein